MSLGQATEFGCEIRMKDDLLTMYEKSGKLVMRATHSKNCLYKIKLKVGNLFCLISKICKDSWLWHARLGHISFKTLQQLNGMALGVPEILQENKVCEACMVGKQTRKPFPNKASFRATQTLELVHGDLCGPISPAMVKR
jgi:hypothetical protein